MRSAATYEGVFRKMKQLESGPIMEIVLPEDQADLWSREQGYVSPDNPVRVVVAVIADGADQLDDAP